MFTVWPSKYLLDFSHQTGLLMGSSEVGPQANTVPIQTTAELEKCLWVFF